MTSDPTLELTLDEPGLESLAASLARRIRPPMTWFLQGDLGAGKTTFARAMLRALGHPGRVKSPTYGLLEHYQLRDLDVLHLDLYRIENEDELEFIGISDLFSEQTILLVEWPERGRAELPEPDFVIQFEHAGARRHLHCSAPSEAGLQVLEAAREDINSISS